MDIDWNSIQGGGPNSCCWDATDRVVRDARARGLKILGMLGYTPGWARPAELPARHRQCLPASPETYADFARAAAQRYGVDEHDPRPAQQHHGLADLERAEPLPVRPADGRRPGVHRDAQAGLRRDQEASTRRHRDRRRHRTGAGRPVRPDMAPVTFLRADLRERRPGLLRRLRPPPVLVPVQPAHQARAGTPSPRPSTSTT